MRVLSPFLCWLGGMGVRHLVGWAACTRCVCVCLRRIAPAHWWWSSPTALLTSCAACRKMGGVRGPAPSGSGSGSSGPFTPLKSSGSEPRGVGPDLGPSGSSLYPLSDLNTARLQQLLSPLRTFDGLESFAGISVPLFHARGEGPGAQRHPPTGSGSSSGSDPFGTLSVREEALAMVLEAMAQSMAMEKMKGAQAQAAAGTGGGGVALGGTRSGLGAPGTAPLSGFKFRVPSANPSSAAAGASTGPAPAPHLHLHHHDHYYHSPPARASGSSGTGTSGVTGSGVPGRGRSPGTARPSGPWQARPSASGAAGRTPSPAGLRRR